MLTRCAIRGASRERCYELFSRLAFRTLVNDYAPTADTVNKDYALVATLAELDALIAELREAGEFALRVIGDDPSAMRASIVGIAFSTADRRARYLPLGHAGAGRRGSAVERHCAAAGGAGAALERLATAARRCLHPQGRPRPEGRHRGAPESPHRAQRARVRLDAGQLSSRCHATGTSAGRDLARTPGLQGADRGRSVRARRKGQPDRPPSRPRQR